MISIPVSEKSHAVLRRLSKWLCLAAFVVVAAFLGLSGLAGYHRANAILKDHSVVDAPVHLDHIEEERGRKGRVSRTYHFRYGFEAGGKRYEGAFGTSEDNAAPYMEEGANVRVAYANARPSQFDRLDKLEGNKHLGAVLRRLAFGLPLLGVLIFVVYLLITRRLFVAQAPQAPQAPPMPPAPPAA